MAQFKIADKITGGNEGGYANNPADRGGETINGIARKFHPNWVGWKHVDSVKSKYSKPGTDFTDRKVWKQIDSHLKSNETFHALVESFYKTNYWDVNKLDQFKDQQVANSVYDFGVNSGTARAARTLQETVNVPADGIIGPQTLKAVNEKDSKLVLEHYNKHREEFYRSIAKGNQTQFLKSWLSRLKPYQ